MRKAFSLVLSLLLLAGTSGCIIVASNHHCRACRMMGDRHVVEIDGETYVVDLEKSTVHKFDESEKTESGK